MSDTIVRLVLAALLYCAALGIFVMVWLRRIPGVRRDPIEIFYPLGVACMTFAAAMGFAQLAQIPDVTWAQIWRRLLPFATLMLGMTAVLILKRVGQRRAAERQEPPAA